MYKAAAFGGVNYDVDLTQKYNSCVTLGGGLIHLMSTVYYETHYWKGYKIIRAQPHNIWNFNVMSR